MVILGCIPGATYSLGGCNLLMYGAILKQALYSITESAYKAYIVSAYSKVVYMDFHVTTNYESYRSRGSVARNHTNVNANRQVLSASTIDCTLMNVSLTITSGITYPPKNSTAVRVLISTIEQYSARKKNTKIMLECSVKNPATSSDSENNYYICDKGRCTHKKV